MSKEVMAECLDEASQAWADHVSSEKWSWDEELGPFTIADKQAIATIAAALYQERMRQPPTTINIPSVWVDPLSATEGSTEWAQG